MGLLAKVRFWRALGVFVNLPGVSQGQDYVRGLVARMSAAMQRRRLDTDIPWTPLSKPLSACTVAVVSTAGLYPRGAEPFDVDADAGDPSFRVIPSDIAFDDLLIAHVHFPHARFEQDKNVLLPMDALRALAERGVVKALARRFYGFGFGGGITSGYVDAKTGTAHAVARMMKEDGVDLALLVPA